MRLPAREAAVSAAPAVQAAAGALAHTPAMPRPSRRSGSSHRASLPWPRLLLAVAAIFLLAWLLRPSAQAPQLQPQSQDSVADVARPGVPAQAGSDFPAFLPAEAGPVIRRIQTGERFAHPQDGSVFGNRERRLPSRRHGYYREYTVPTPGLEHRGARRIVTGGDPPGEWYYTADHYRSFRAFQPPSREAAR